MFEPIGGSAPKYTGQGRHQPDGGDRRLPDACSRTSARTTPPRASTARSRTCVSTKLKSMQAGQMGYSTSQVGDLVVAAIEGG